MSHKVKKIKIVATPEDCQENCQEEQAKREKLEKLTKLWFRLASDTKPESKSLMVKVDKRIKTIHDERKKRYQEKLLEDFKSVVCQHDPEDMDDEEWKKINAEIYQKHAKSD